MDESTLLLLVISGAIFLMAAYAVITGLLRRDNARLSKMLIERSHMALHDPLTQLPNRVLFMERLSHAVLRLTRTPGAVVLMYLDLDGFKGINDKMGHQAGDLLLVEFAQRLKQSLRETDCIARMGGDEFTVILEHLRNPRQQVLLVARKIMEAMALPFNLAGREVAMTASIGIAITTLGQRDIEEMIKSADAELYKAKNSGKNQFSMEEDAPTAG